MVDKDPRRSPYPASLLTVSGLRLFESVARHSSFSRAAEELNVSQPYVSSQIHELEVRLRVSLFRRVGRRVYLTEPGVLLRRHADGLLSGIAATEREIAELRNVIVGRLELATVVIAAEHILPRVLGAFRSQYPEVSLSLQVYNSKQVEQAVSDGRCELGVTLSHSPPPELEATQFGVDELVLVAGKHHPLANETVVTPDALSKEPLLVREPTSGTRLFIESTFAELGISLCYELELNSNQLIKGLVEANVGVAIISRRIVQAEILAGRLTLLKIAGLTLERPLTLVCRKKPLSAPAKAFRTLLMANTSDDSRLKNNEPQ